MELYSVIKFRVTVRWFVCEGANGVQFKTAKFYSCDCKRRPNVRHMNNGLGSVLACTSINSFQA